MNAYLKKGLDRSKEIYGRLEFRQKIILAALTVITVIVFSWLISWSTKVEYGLLFGNMDPQSASQIIETLEEQKVPYKLQDEGKSVYVPKNLVYETRIKLSSEGIGISHETGYEIFDKSTLGMTEFIQNINYQRAMEGELKRTIESIKGVEMARVHLVFPEEKIFKEDQQQPTASVVLHLKEKLNEGKIQGIANLIASAVEGLDVSKVTIIDQNGNILSENYDDTTIGMSNSQLKIQQQVENLLTIKTQSMLDNILGAGNSVVRVTTELNFDKTETTAEIYDPNSKVVRSEESSVSNVEERADSVTESSEHLVTNYEISKTIQHVISQVGGIKRMTVAVNLNQVKEIRQEDGKTITEYKERAPEQIAQIEQLVQNAVGYNQERGDQVVVSSMKFDETEVEFYKEQQQKEEQKRQYSAMGEKAAVILILIILLFVLYSQFKKIFAVKEAEETVVRPQLTEGAAESEGFYPEGEEGLPMGEGKITYTFKPMRDIEIEQTASQQLQDAVRTFIMENPELSAKLLKSWLLEKKGF